MSALSKTEIWLLILEINKEFKKLEKLVNFGLMQFFLDHKTLTIR
jgi:hypothetical protein